MSTRYAFTSRECRRLFSAIAKVAKSDRAYTLGCGSMNAKYMSLFVRMFKELSDTACLHGMAHSVRTS